MKVKMTQNRPWLGQVTNSEEKAIKENKRN